MDIRNPVLGILVSGRPTPGVNAALSSCVIEAINRKQEVIGFLSGWNYLRDGISSQVKRLKIPHVSNISKTGGSFLKTSKAELEKISHYTNTISVLKHFGVKNLICIGWTQSALTLLNLEDKAASCGYDLKTALIPISIYSDLPLPLHSATFGFSTARDFGAKLATNFYKDARSNDRWYITNVVGARTGHLCLAIGRNSSATISLVQEDFEHGTKLDEIVDHVEVCIMKRSVLGKQYGICLISEGIVDKMDSSEVAKLFGSVEEGHSLLSKRVCEALKERAKQRALPFPTLVSASVGFEIRCSDPDTTDHDIGRNLGYGAARVLLVDRVGSRAVVQQSDSLVTVPLSHFFGLGETQKWGEIDLSERENGTERTKQGSNSAQLSSYSHVEKEWVMKYPLELMEKVAWSYVLKESLSYIVSSEYMMKLKASDLEDKAFVFKMGQMLKMTSGDALKHCTRLAV